MPFSVIQIVQKALTFFIYMPSYFFKKQEWS